MNKEKNIKLDDIIDYANELEDKLNNAEKIIDKIDEIVFKTGSLEEKEWEKIQNKYKNIEMSNLAIKTLNKIIYELWELRYENDTVSDYIKEVCYETVEKFQDCLDDLLLD